MRVPLFEVSGLWIFCVVEVFYLISVACLLLWYCALILPFQSIRPSIWGLAHGINSHFDAIRQFIQLGDLGWVYTSFLSFIRYIIRPSFLFLWY